MMLRLADLVAELEKRAPQLLVEYDAVSGGDRAGDEYMVFGMATRSLCGKIETSRQTGGGADAATAGLIDSALALFNEMAESSDAEVVNLAIEVLEEFACHPAALKCCLPLMRPRLRKLLKRVGEYMRLEEGLDLGD